MPKAKAVSSEFADPNVENEVIPNVEQEANPNVENNVKVLPLKVTAELKETLEKYPYIDCVFVNENGEWLFCDRPGFTAYSREEILNG